MFEVWITDGHYIQGKKLRGKEGDKKKALAKATKALKKAKFGDTFKLVPDRKTDEVWIEDDEGRPMGILVPVE